jgi:hypothetical protein
MANTTISALTAATSVAGADLIPIVQGGTTKKASVSQLPTGAVAYPRNPNPQGQNLKGWNVDPLACGTTVSSGAADVLYLVKILTPDSVSISNVLFVIGTTATTDASGFYVAIINPDGTIARQSADIASTVNATAASTLVTAPLSSAVTVGGAGVTDFVYAALGYDAATTNPNFLALPGIAAQHAAVNAGLTSSTKRHGTLTNTVWPLTGTLTLSSMAQAGTPKHFWMGVS